MAKQPPSSGEEDLVAAMNKEIDKLLDADTFNKDQKALALQLALLIHMRILPIAAASRIMQAQSNTDQGRIILMAFKVCTAVFQKAVDLGITA